MPPEWKGLEKEWREQLSQFPGQMEFTLDSGLRFTDEQEVWFEFRGTRFRWINETATMKAVLVVPVSNRNDYKAEYEESLRFLSHLAFETNSPITGAPSVSGKSSFVPMTAQSRRSGGIRYPQVPSIRTERVLSAKLDRALALYREGLGSGSVFYSFLSFYKVLQLVFDEKPGRIRTWISENLETV